MLNSKDISATLLAVQEVEISFNRTLRNINSINHRYNMISSMKKKAVKAQESFEDEIQAAITKPSPSRSSNLSKKNLKKTKNLPLGDNKRVKKGNKAKITKAQDSFLAKKPKKSPTKKMNKGNREKITERATESPLSALPPIPYKDWESQTIFLRTTNCTYEIYNTTPKIAPRKPYVNLIRRLYRAARRKNQQETRDQQDREQCLHCSICSCSCSSC